MKKMKAKNIKAGQTVYYAHALGEHSFVTKYIVRSRPYVSPRTGYIFVRAGFVFSDGTIGKFDSDFSLGDCNVGEINNYNYHRLFFKKKAADRYVKMCKELDIIKQRNTDSGSWDYPLEMDDYWDEPSLDDDRS
ncbi:hypothetical protein AsFcp4_221 [Aeromonas phage AsFcp_4]|uniref:Uncharacterized protein n=1 Tax=Aeromonas phage PX29 TaxID=926067 RepID=E5DPZ6_9CAUD|nr:hypothetical protein CL89_gp063 [Aeromonas phage PX29]ADQ52782.1 hypothetical protein PX29p063 [Aeromonas phage PX29]QAX99674.1 hypothetical protein AsFcp4_221 [Aeromonas phage AsFcp_4]